MKGPPRIAFKLLVFVLAGAIINIAVAWACVNLSRRSTPTLDRWEAGTEDELIWQQSAPKALAELRPYMRNTRSSGLGVLCETIWATNGYMERFIERDELMPAINSWRMNVSSGLPMFALSGVHWRAVDERSETSHTKLLQHGVFSIARGPHEKPLVFPLHPIFPGFAINTIFYAAILWMLFAVPGRCGGGFASGAASVHHAGIRCAARQTLRSVLNVARSRPSGAQECSHGWRSPPPGRATATPGCEVLLSLTPEG